MSLDPSAGSGEPRVSGVSGPLIDLPHRGNRLIIVCRQCGREAFISGRDICLRFTGALARPVEEWAASLSCGECRSRWVLVSSQHDPSGVRFQQSIYDTPQMIWARRLAAYLAEAGTDLEAFRGVLRDLPTRAEVAELVRGGARADLPATL